MAYFAKFVGFETPARLTVTKETYQKCWVDYNGDYFTINVFGEDNLNKLKENSIIELRKRKMYSGKWKGFEFIDGKPLNIHHNIAPMNFSVANGFEVSELPF